MASGPHIHDRHSELDGPFALIAVAVVVVLAVVVVVLNFLVAPLAILTAFVLGFAALERSSGSAG